MKNRRRFRPSLHPEQLEDRIVMDNGVRPFSVLVGGLYGPGALALRANRPQQPVVALVDKAFASFNEDYGQARGIYFASITSDPTPDPANLASFVSYTEQRVNLLAQELINSMQSPRGVLRVNGISEAIPQFVGRRLNLRLPNGQPAPGTLTSSLVDAIPSTLASKESSTLFSLSQDNAIAASRISMINGINIFRTARFLNKK